jgi:hypothetical protein
MSAKGNSTEEEFEVIKFIEESAPFTMFLVKPWTQRNQARREEKMS